MASQKHVSDTLNQFLRLARTAKLQYEQHLAAVEHEPAQSILADIIEEEAQHVQWLVSAIEGVGGTPTTDTDDLVVPEEFELMMRENYDLESTIVREFEHHLDEIWDPQLRTLITTLLERARQHQDAFRGLFEDFGTDELMDRPA